MIIWVFFLLLKQVSPGPYVRKTAFIASNPDILLAGNEEG